MEASKLELPHELLRLGTVQSTKPDFESVVVHVLYLAVLNLIDTQLMRVSQLEIESRLGLLGPLPVAPAQEDSHWVCLIFFRLK